MVSGTSKERTQHILAGASLAVLEDPGTVVHVAAYSLMQASDDLMCMSTGSDAGVTLLGNSWSTWRAAQQ